MELQISKWGNSLAVRIPAEFVRRTGLKEGDRVKAVVAADGSLVIQTEQWDRAKFAGKLAKDRERMKMGTSVMEELRQGSRY